MILAAQKEACDESVGLQKGLDKIIEHRSDGALYYLDRIWVPLKGDVRNLIMDEAHRSKYYVHPRADKMYYDLRDTYWWLGMKKDITIYKLKIPKWKREGIAMDFVTKLPRTSSGHETIWVIVDRLTKSTHFIPLREDYKMDRLAKLYLNEIVSRHGYSISEDSKHEPILEEPCKEPKEEGYLEETEKEADSNLLSDARSRLGLAESGDSCKSKVKPKRVLV
nr:putative reverse transcriptase domain-containing protein [Tanacetum cinerariifolium]